MYKIYEDEFLIDPVSQYMKDPSEKKYGKSESKYIFEYRTYDATCYSELMQKHKK